MDRILETERLCLRKIHEGDFQAISSILQNEAVMYAWERAFTTEEVKEWIAENIMRYDRDGFSFWAVIEKATNILIGVAGIITEKVDDESCVGVAYIFNNAYWHKGFAHEAAAACVSYALNVLNLDEITAQIRPDNISSIRVVEKLGMTVVRSFIHKSHEKDVPRLLYCRRKDANDDELRNRQQKAQEL